ncbi:hypothetical protein ABMC88_17370 [Sulfitobacter sp. HNIBRBA2951]|uniref:hypothetical protein n=1 Tax=Sulfitobacter aquimarinus TaxID=3158557 RepID=UPI0032E04697
MTEQSFRVRLSFWGTETEYYFPTREDAEHIANYFAEHLSAAVEPKQSFFFRTSRGGFIAGLTDETVEKEIWHLVEGQDWVLWDRFEQKSKRETPLPPFTLPPLSTDYGFFHAAALATPDGHGGLFMGPSFSGKSALSLKLAFAGWGLLTDDLAAIRVEDRTIQAFRRPIGIRDNTFNLVPELLAAVAGNTKSTKIDFGDVSTHMVHASALGLPWLPNKTPLQFLVSLCNEPGQGPAMLVDCPQEDKIRTLQKNLNGNQLPVWIKGLPCWTLRYDLETQLDQVASCLNSKLESCHF